MKLLHMGAFIFVIVGGLSWGLIGAFDFNLVKAVFGAMPMVEKAVYILVGLSSIYLVATHASDCKACAMKKK
jgi:uncharacterized membrane protein YuzA (DUF378 family)